MFKKATTMLDAQIAAAVRQAGGVFQTRFGLWLLGMISFVESVLVVPLVTDPFLVAYILVNRGRTAVAVLVTTVTSAAGGVVAYATAVALFDFVSGRYLTGEHLAEFYVIAERFNECVFTLTLLGAVTPIPYTLVALAAGFVGADFLLFLLATFIGRGGRYLLVGYLTQRYGQQALKRVERHVTIATLTVVVLGALYLFLFKL